MNLQHAVAYRRSPCVDHHSTTRPIAATVGEYPAGHHEPRHHHSRAQLLYACTGVMLVTTDNASFVVQPQRALWIPPGVEHEVFTRYQASTRCLYVSPNASRDLPQNCRATEVSPFMRELIIEAAKAPAEYDTDGRDGLVMQLLLKEIASQHRADLHLPMPRNDRLVKVCRAILRDPACNDVLEDWATTAGMPPRTFTRTFRRETGVSFATWRQNARLMDAVSRLALGQSIGTVAFDVGYGSASAFTAMFRRTFGVSPRSYLRTL